MEKQVLRSGRRYVALVLLVVVLVTGLYCPVFAAETVTLSMVAPQQDYYSTVFGEDMSYQVTVNGEVKTFKGVPYLYGDYTYIPMRDLCEAFGIKVDYDQRDRSIMLSTNDKCIIFTSTSLSNQDVIIMDSNAGHIKPDDYFSYTMSNGIAYIPLRFVSERFGLKVGYEDGQATVSGAYLGPVTKQDWFSEEQQLLIEAARNTEGAKQITAQVTGDEVPDYTAIITRNFTREGYHVEEITYVTEPGGDKYVGNRSAMGQSISRGLEKELPDGSRMSIDLGRGAMGYHPYNMAGMTALEGIHKYRELDITTLNRTDSEVTYQVAYDFYGWSESLEFTIDLASKTITKYAVDGSKTVYYSDYLF